MTYSITTQHVQRSVEAYQRHINGQLQNSIKLICAHLDNPNPKYLDDAACCIASACNASRAIMESSWRHFYLTKTAEFGFTHTAENPDRGWGKKFPFGENEQDLLQSKVRYVTDTGNYSNLLDALKKVQKYNLGHIKTLEDISNQFKHIAIDLINHGQPKEIDFSQGPVRIGDGFLVGEPESSVGTENTDQGQILELNSKFTLTNENDAACVGCTGFRPPGHMMLTLVSPENVNLRSGYLHLKAEIGLSNGDEQHILPELSESAFYVPENMVFLKDGDMQVFFFDIDGFKINPFEIFSIDTLPKINAFATAAIGSC